MSRPEKNKKLSALSRKLGVAVRRLQYVGLDRDVSPLARKVLINQIKRSTQRAGVRANG
jgi:hypothetical protein